MSLSSKLSIKDVSLKGERVLIRVDFNVPMDKKTNEITNPAVSVCAREHVPAERRPSSSSRHAPVDRPSGYALCPRLLELELLASSGLDGRGERWG